MKAYFREENIDILKAICAFLIVCIHIPFPGTAGAYFTALTRISVPIFFMITGYFYKNTLTRKREGKKIKKIAIMILLSNWLYLVWDMLLALLKGEGLFGYLAGAFTAKNMLKFLLLNESPFSGHLWYMGQYYMFW